MTSLNITITKDQFQKILEGIQNQHEKDRVFSQAITERCESVGVCFSTDLCSETILFLQEILHDTDNDWIGYFIYELDWGSKYSPGMVKWRGENIPMGTIEDLWNILVSHLEEK